IYVDFVDENAPTKLVIKAINNGSFVFNDNISGKVGYYLEIGSPDNTGSISFKTNTSIGNANVTFAGGTLSFMEQTFVNSSLDLQGGNIDFTDGATTQYIINLLSSSGDNVTNFSLDFNFRSGDTNSVDFIRLLNPCTEKVVLCIDKLNVLYNGNAVGEMDVFTEFSQAIVTKDMNVELVISEQLKSMPFLLEIVNRSVGIVLPEVVKFNDDIYEKFEIGKKYGYLSVSDNSLELRGNDEIVWTGKYDGEGIKVSGGTLNIVNTQESTQKKIFLSDDSSDVYNVESDLGVSAKGDLAIYGVKDEDSISTIDMILHKGFVIANSTIFEVKNIRFMNAQTTDNGSVVNITNGDTTTNFENVIFEENTSTGHGGAFANTAEIINLIADFSNNRCSLNGAGLYNTGHIINLSGTYKSNITSSDRSNAGAIYNSGIIDKIYSSSFVSNSATINGGAILNTGSIIDIEADFSNNTTTSNGGAIVNRGNISSIIGNFVNNGIRGSYSAQGGAILNVGTIDSIINSTFVGNYANISANYGSTLGGAIYTKSSINFIANNGFEMLFDGNYTQIGSNGKISSAIYVDNSDVTLLFDSRENSRIVVNDIISGINGYRILVNGDSTGFVGFYHFITGAELELRNVTMSFSAGTFENMNVNLLSGKIDFLDDKAVNYRLKSLKIANNVKFNIDIKSELDGNNICDTITVTDEKNTSGTVFLDRINFDYEKLPTTDVYLKVLSGDSLELACNFDNIYHVDADGNLQHLENKFVISKEGVYDNETVIPTTIAFNQTIYKNIIETVTYGHFELYEWLEYDEALGRELNVKGLLYKVQVVAEPSKPSDIPLGDSLKLISNLQIDDPKFFVATEDCNEYFVTDDIYDVHGNLTLKGLNESSVINFTNDSVTYNVFEMTKNSVLTVDTMKLTGSTDVIFVKDTSAEINLVDAYIDGDVSPKNILGQGRYNVNINGFKTTTLAGMLIDANVNLNSGKLVINQGSLRFSNLVINGGLLSCLDNNTAIYDIEKITVGEGACPLVDIDLDLNNLKSDVLNVQSQSSNGYIYLNNIDIIGNVEEMVLSGNQDEVINILSTSSSDLKLVLSEKAQECIEKVVYEDVEITNRVLETIKDTTRWDYIYNKTEHKEGDLYSLGLSSSERDLQIYVSQISGDFVSSMGDTLRLVNNDKTNQTKFFVTDDRMAKYYVTENLGSTYNNLTIKGVVSEGVYSTISLISDDEYNIYSGFELEQNSVLKLDSVKLTGNDTLINVKDVSAKVVIMNSFIDGNIISDSNNYMVDISNEFVMTGEFRNADVVSSNSDMKFSTSTFADVNTSLMLLNSGVNFIDDKYDNYLINSLSTDDSTVFNYDLDIVSSKSDCLVLNSFEGEKTITIEEFNIIGGVENIIDFVGVTLLVADGTIVLGEKAKQQLDELYILEPPEKSYDESIFLSPEITWEDSKTTIYDISKKYLIGLNSTKTGLELIIDEDIKESYTDEWTLSIFNQSEDYFDKVYGTENANTVQNIGRDLGETNGYLTVSGTIFGEDISTINLRDYSGFVLGEKSIGLKLDSVKFVTTKNQDGNLVYAINNNATLELNNVVVDSSASEGSAIYTTSNLAISATSGQSTVMKSNNAVNYVDVFVDGEGEKSLSLIASENSKVVLNSGIKFGDNVDLKLDVNRIGSASGLVQLSLKGDLGSEVNPISELNLNGGEFSVVDNVISNIYVDSLNINESTIFDIDIDCINNDADKIILSNVLETNSTGKKLILSIDDINIINNEYKAMKFKLLNVNTSTSDFVELKDVVGNELSLGVGSDGFDYVLKLGSHGYIIIESNQSFAEHPFVVAINKTTSNKYVLNEILILNNYG
ncbi:hypothetical protein IKJ53_04080, partial [bacterium]|nr:hypothetical protein [bacterium]